MISIKKCREYLGNLAKDMTDEQVINAREQLYGLGELALEDYFDSIRNKKVMKIPPSLHRTMDDKVKNHYVKTQRMP